MEIWKKVKYPKYGDFYEVSNFGQVRNIQTKKILKTHLRMGYKALSLYNSDDNTQKLYLFTDSSL